MVKIASSLFNLGIFIIFISLIAIAGFGIYDIFFGIEITTTAQLIESAAPTWRANALASGSLLSAFGITLALISSLFSSKLQNNSM